jgi:phage shock protein C
MAKKLYRSTTDRWIAGVCGGIGEYLEIDPNVIRVIWVIITALTGFLPGILVYILLWIILPHAGTCVRPRRMLGLEGATGRRAEFEKTRSVFEWRRSVRSGA